MSRAAFLLAIWTVALPTAAGCGDDDAANADGGMDDGGPNDGARDANRDANRDASTNRCQGPFSFGAGREWGLPTDFGDQPRPGTLADQAACDGTGDLRHIVLQFDGDGRPDLLITDDCNPSTDLGARFWRLYKGETNGLAATPTDIELPTDFGTQPQAGLAEDQTCDDFGDTLHALVDLNGDDRLDLVLTSDCNGETGLGSVEWRAHLGTSTGFNKDGQAWTLPSGFGDQEAPGLLRDQQGCRPGLTDSMHDLFDVDGDGRSDLVITDDCNLDTDLGAGSWSVHRSTGNGFESNGTELTLPLGFGAQASPGLTQDQGDCGDPGDFLHVIVDVDGDERPDMLITDDCDDETPLGTDTWRLHRGAAGRFADAQDLALPTGLKGQPSPRRYGYQSSCRGVGDQLHVPLDLNGDGRLDLLVTDDCDDNTELGRSEWSAHLGEAGGFAATGQKVTLPAAFADQPAPGLAADQECAGEGDHLHQLAMTDGDDRPDLVIHADCTAGTELGERHFRVHSLSCN